LAKPLQYCKLLLYCRTYLAKAVTSIIVVKQLKSIFMVENLNNLVKENADTAIIHNTAIPNERNEEVVQEASTAIENSLKTSLAGGNVKEVANLFNKQPTTL
jgi:hypothetical protein